MKLSAIVRVLVVLSIFVGVASASASSSEILKALLDARQGLVTLLDTTDTTAQGKLEADIKKNSKLVDEGLKAALSDKATRTEDLPKYKDFSSVWEAFKKTRDSEIIPAIKAGKVSDAKALAKGVQAERFAKMKELLGSLGAK
ncbi:MAG: secreted protein [Myxococcaceae bacterium]|nr:secreted protein [Myxococcaceae bacterium]